MAQIHELVSDEFRKLVAARHGQNRTGIPHMPGFRSTEVAAMHPDEHRYLLHHAASIQRGAPEQRMLELQRVTRGGMLSHSAEHIGDLTHRLNEQGGRYGTEFVEPKVSSQLRYLTHRYGFEREHLEQMHSTAAMQGVSFDEHLGQVRAAGQAYSAAHSQVPVYNMPSKHGAWAARSLGAMRFDATTAHIRNLSDVLKNSTQFRHQMSQAGSVEYLREQEESLGL